MIHTSQSAKRFAAAALCFIMVFTAAVPMLTTQASAATIKTQTAANNIPNGIRGIDVSRHNGVIDWAKVAQDNVEFVFVRASSGAIESGKYVLKQDPTFITNATGAHANGIKVGAYHAALFVDRSTMLQEAQFFINQLKKVTLTYPVVLDLEYDRAGLSKSALTSLAIEFMETVQSAGYKVLLYSYQNFINDQLSRSAINDHEFWVANYIEEPTGFDHQIWQHTASGTVKGIKGNVDINIAYKDFSTNVIRIPKATADNVKSFLNQHYNANIDLEAKLDIDRLNNTIARGFQTEVNNQLGGSVNINGSPTENEVRALGAINFRVGETKGRITTLIQCRLIYTGCYTQDINGLFDDTMVTALKNFQSKHGLTQTGTMDEATWRKMLFIN